MMNFDKMKMTHRKLDEYTYQVRVGNDIIVVSTNFGHLRFPNTLKVRPITHYIGTPDNKPTNLHRTTYLLTAVENYFYKLVLKEMEQDLRDLAMLPTSDYLQNDYRGRRFTFYKGISPNDIYNEIVTSYMAFNHLILASVKDIYDIVVELSNQEDGFLTTAIRDSLNF